MNQNYRLSVYKHFYNWIRNLITNSQFRQIITSYESAIISTEFLKSGLIVLVEYIINYDFEYKVNFLIFIYPEKGERNFITLTLFALLAEFPILILLLLLFSPLLLLLESLDW